MLFFSLEESLVMAVFAIALDLAIGDPRWLPHPVLLIGKAIAALERRWLRGRHPRTYGVLLAATVTLASFAAVWLICRLLGLVHPYLGYAAHIWLIASTIAIKGLKDAAMLVHDPLQRGDLAEARARVGEIVGRDTDRLDESEISRAAVETVAENTVDAVVAPLFYALIGAAPLAMLYRAANTLDSMVGYKNEKYRDFGWASARLDDLLNLVPARLCGVLLVLAAALTKGLSAGRAWRAIIVFARLHPSPNSGIPESAVAGALGVQLGGVNYYGGARSERARMGWSLRPLDKQDIRLTAGLLYKASMLIAGGLLVWALVGAGGNGLWH